MSTFKAEGYQLREESLQGWPVRIASYRLQTTWLCKIDNVSPGATIARGEGTTREEAEKDAIESAERRLGATRRLLEARKALDEALGLLSREELEAAKKR